MMPTTIKRAISYNLNNLKKTVYVTNLFNPFIVCNYLPTYYSAAQNKQPHNAL